MAYDHTEGTSNVGSESLQLEMFLWLSYQDAEHLINIIYMYYQYGTLKNLGRRNLSDFGNNKIVSHESSANIGSLCGQWFKLHRSKTGPSLLF